MFKAVRSFRDGIQNRCLSRPRRRVRAFDQRPREGATAPLQAGGYHKRCAGRVHRGACQPRRRNCDSRHRKHCLGREFRVGGWGFPLSDEGSGAWLGSRALTQVLHAHDGLLPWTSLLRALFERFQNDPYAIVRWMRDSRPRDYAAFAPIICSQASQGDAAARYLMQSAAAHIDALSARRRASRLPSWRPSNKHAALSFRPHATVPSCPHR
jgi:hypothetical protein